MGAESSVAPTYDYERAPLPQRAAETVLPLLTPTPESLVQREPAQVQVAALTRSMGEGGTVVVCKKCEK